MKSFTFRLDRILRLREEAEQRQARVMGAAARTEAELDQLCVEQRNYVVGVGAKAAPVAGERTNAGVLRALHLAAQAAAGQLAEAEKARDEARLAADQERVRLAAAQRERRTLERLKEHQRHAWGEELARDEQKTMDEVTARSKGKGRS